MAAKIRPITFAKTADGVWMNHETGVRIFRSHRRGYLIDLPFLGVTEGNFTWRQGGGGWLLYSTDPCATLKQARVSAARQAEWIREVIANAYDTAMEENFKRDHAEALQMDLSTGLAHDAQLDAFLVRHDHRTWVTPEVIRELVERDHEEAMERDGAIDYDASWYLAGNDDTIVRINANQTWYGNAVRAEMQRREAEAEAEYDRISEAYL